MPKIYSAYLAMALRRLPPLAQACFDLWTQVSGGIRHMLRLAQDRFKRDKTAKAFRFERASLGVGFAAKHSAELLGVGLCRDHGYDFAGPAPGPARPEDRHETRFPPPRFAWA